MAVEITLITKVTSSIVLPPFRSPRIATARGFAKINRIIKQIIPRVIEICFPILKALCLAS